MITRICRLSSGLLSRLRTCTSTSAYYHSKSGVYGHRQQDARTGHHVPDAAIQNRIEHSNVYRLIEAYRTHGHKKATLDPLALQPEVDPHELAPERYGISSGSDVIDVTGLFHGNNVPTMSVTDLIGQLEKQYCDTIAAEFQYLRVTIVTDL